MMFSRITSGALLMLGVVADHDYRGGQSFNGVTVEGIRVGKETQTTQGEQVTPEDNPDTVLDETTFSIDVTYATVFNEAMDKDYFYLINTLKMPKPPSEYPNFTVMLYTQIITSNDNPLLYESTTPTFETVSATQPFYGEENIDKQLWMLNNYAYTERTGTEAAQTTLYYATGFWNTQLASDKIATGNNELLWGFDATESHQNVTTTTITSDDPAQADTTETEYSFEVAVYRLFDNDLSALQITTGMQLFYKVGVKIFDNTSSDEASDVVQLANGISTYLELTVPDGALTLWSSATAVASLAFFQLLF